jgi:hypothetical protein
MVANKNASSGAGRLVHIVKNLLAFFIVPIVDDQFQKVDICLGDGGGLEHVASHICATILHSHGFGKMAFLVLHHNGKIKDNPLLDVRIVQ